MESLSDKMKKSLPRWWKKRFSATITESDPSCKVIYLGNVLTGWAKGEGCLDKPLATLWKNYCLSNRPDVSMRLTVCSSGLQATTAEHGLTEYWSHRVTWCAAPPSYPRIFAWVYRHEGRRLKQELRCHAVLCATGRQARQLTARLEQRLREALHDFRREKLCRQSARLSVASCLYEDYSTAIPKRKLLLAPGINNYRPPVERCKSAPKLGSIEEAPEQEEVEEKEWLRVLAQRSQQLRASKFPVHSGANVLRTLETVNEEEKSLPPLKPICTERSLSLTSLSDPESNPDAVSPNGLQDLAEIKVTLVPDGGSSCVDGVVLNGNNEGKPRLPLPSILCRRIGIEAKMFGSADCVTESERRTPSPPSFPRRIRRSLPCRAANVNDFTSDLHQNRQLTRRQSQPEYLGIDRRSSCEYFESREDFLFNQINYRLRLDSAVELLENDSFSGSPCSSPDQSPNLTEKSRIILTCHGNASDAPLLAEDNDNVSDESGYSDDKDVTSSSSSGSDITVRKTTKNCNIGRVALAEEFTLNL